MTRAVLAFGAAVLLAQGTAQQAPVAVTVTNPGDMTRPSETIVLPAADVQRAVPVKDLRAIHVKDEKTGADLLTQAVDTNDDGTFDELIFQADLGAREARRFTLTAGQRRIPAKDDFRAYGRFVRERRDDFAWENDKVAHRMYGAALERWAQEPLTSSAVDVWVKRTPRLVVNDWYMVDDYHHDTGEGADLYSAGKTRGCGGSGIWKDGRLYTSANFRNSRVLANGPIRVMFELTYLPWEAGGTPVAETKRISLDAGQHLNRFESTYTPALPQGAAVGIGIRIAKGSDFPVTPPAGVLRSWEPLTGNEGYLGCGVIAPSMLETRKAEGDYLVIARPAGTTVVYYAGSAWDRAGEIKTVADWDDYLTREAARIRTPVRVEWPGLQSGRSAIFPPGRGLPIIGAGIGPTTYAHGQRGPAGRR